MNEYSRIGFGNGTGSWLPKPVNRPSKLVYLALPTAVFFFYSFKQNKKNWFLHAELIHWLMDLSGLTPLRTHTHSHTDAVDIGRRFPTQLQRNMKSNEKEKKEKKKVEFFPVWLHFQRFSLRLSFSQRTLFNVNDKARAASIV